MSTSLNISPLLDVAIGMCLLFAMTSTCASAFVELMETFFRRRAKFLAQGVSEVLGALSANSPQLPEMVKAFYESPFIVSLYRGRVQRADAGAGHVAAERGEGTLPAYIPPERFAQALLHLAQNPSAQGQEPNALQQQFAQLVATYTAGVPVADHVKHLSTLFDDSTQRVAGWYRRHVQWVLLFSGMVLSVALNLDAMRWLQVLSTQEAVRTALVAQADKLQQQALQTNPSPVLRACEPPQEGSAACQDAKNAMFKSATDLLAQTGLPIGWQGDSFWPTNGTCQAQILAVVSKVFGLLLTALATCLGAPFWFDLLNRVTHLRSVVKPAASKP